MHTDDDTLTTSHPQPAASIESSAARPVDDLLQGDHHIAMVMTMIGDTHSSRPVTCVAVYDHRLSFLVNRSVDWVQAIAENRAVVHVTVADVARNVYVSLSGTAIVVHDEAEIARLWCPAARDFFDGPDDPQAAALHFDVTAGEYWEGPSGRLGRAVALLRAAMSGDEPDGGGQGAVLGTDTID